MIVRRALVSDYVIEFFATQFNIPVEESTRLDSIELGSDPQIRLVAGLDLFLRSLNPTATFTKDDLAKAESIGDIISDIWNKIIRGNE